MINSGEYGLEALRPPPDPAAFRHYHGAASQYRGTPQVRHFWPPTPPPDGRYGGRSVVNLLAPAHDGGGAGTVYTNPHYSDHPSHKEVYFSPAASPQQHHAALVAPPSALVDPRHYSAFSVFNKPPGGEYHPAIPADKKLVGFEESCQDLRLRPEAADYPLRPKKECIVPTKLKKEKETATFHSHHQSSYLLSRPNLPPSSKSVPMTPRSTSSQHPSYAPIEFHSTRQQHLIPESHRLPYSHHPSVVVKQEIRDDSPPPPQHHHHSMSLPPPPPSKTAPPYLLDPRHPSRGVEQQPTNLVMNKNEHPSDPDQLRHKPYPANNKFYHSHQNSPFSPPPQIAFSQQSCALSSLQSMVSLSGSQSSYDTPPPIAHRAKHSPPVGCVLPMPSAPSRQATSENKKPNYAFTPQEPVTIPVGIAHAHQRAKDLTLPPDRSGKEEQDINASVPLKKSEHLTPSKLVLPPQPVGPIREYKEEFLEKTSFSHFPLTSPILPHQSGLPPNAVTGGGGRWCQPWFPHIWPATGGVPDGCQIVKDPHTGQLLLVDPATGNIATLMGPPSHHWPPYSLESSKPPPIDLAADLRDVVGSKIVQTKSIKEESPKIAIKMEKEEIKKDEELESKEIISTPPLLPTALPTPAPSAGEEEDKDDVMPKSITNESANTSGLQLLLDVLENEKPVIEPLSKSSTPPLSSQNSTPTTFEMLCSYAHEVFEKEQLEETPPPLPKLSSAQKADLSKKVLSLTQAKQDSILELKAEPSELKLRQQLADLQRKYQENQRGLAELVPKKKSSNPKHKSMRPKSSPPSETTVIKVEHSPTNKPEVGFKKKEAKVSRNVSLRSKTQPLSDHEVKRKLSPKEHELVSKENTSPSKENITNPNVKTKKANKVKRLPSSPCKKSILGEEPTPQHSDPDSSPKKEPKAKTLLNKSEGIQRESSNSRKRKLVKPKKSSSSKSEKTETIVDRVSRNLLFIKAQSIFKENSGGEEDSDLEEEEVGKPPAERKRLRTKPKKHEPTKTSSRLSKTQASLSIKKQIGQQQKGSPEKRDKVVKRTRLSLLKRRTRECRQQLSNSGSEELSPSKKGRSEIDDTSPSSRRGGDKNCKKDGEEEGTSCMLREEHLVENTRVLVLEDGLLYAGILIDLQPPKVYGVVLDGSRGTSPRLFSRDELFQSAVREVKPTKVLSEGTRVCAYWSQQYQCLYPGLVAKETSLSDSKSMFVQFDDGDSGKIPFTDIRLLAPHIIELNKEEPRSPHPTSSKSSAEDSRPLRKKKTPNPTKAVSEKKKPPPTQSSGVKSKGSLRLRLSRVIRKRGDLGYHHFFHRRRSLTTRPNSLSPSKLRVQTSSSASVGDSNNKTESSTTSPKSNKIEELKDQLWRWHGKSFRKVGLKGSKAKREYYRAISKKNEKILVGDCVVFLSPSNQQRNSFAVGRVESFWQQPVDTNMTVRIKLFVHPHDTPNRSSHALKAALYQSTQEEEKDVQSISHKCQVISSYEEFCQRKDKQSSDSNTAVFYIAGSYDSSTGQVAPYSHTPC